MSRVLCLVLLVFISPSLKASLLKKERGYDKPLYVLERTPSTYVDSDRIFLLPENGRFAAFQMLSGKKVLELDNEQLTALLGENIDASELLDVLSKKIDKHIQWRQSELKKRPQPTVSFWDFFRRNDNSRNVEIDQQLIGLDQLHAEYVRSLKGRLKPYLVSVEAPAVVASNVTGWIEKNNLHIMSVQYGNYTEVVSLPFIVFLEFEPKDVIPHRLTFR